MSVSFRAAGTWENGSTGLTADEVVAIPAAQVTGDLVLVIACWKDYAITAQVAGYTELIEIADGTTGTGNGTGSMKIGVWYKVATSDTESDPTVDFSTTTGLVGEATVLVFSASNPNWLTPTYVQAAWTNSGGPATRNAGSTITVPSGGAVVAIAAIRDDSATFTRGTTDIADSGGLITWNGNYAEQPATHASTTTGDDMSCDAGYRLVTTGAAGVTLQQSIQALSASETGNLLWVVLGDAPNPSATGAISLAATTASGTGAETFTATGAPSLASTTVSGTGAETFTATGAPSLAATTVAGTGDHTENTTNPEGTGAPSLAATTVDGTGALVFTATGAIEIPAAMAAGLGAEVFTGTGDPALSAVTATGDGLHIENVTGTGAVVLAAMTVTGSGTGPGGGHAPGGKPIQLRRTDPDADEAYLLVV